MVNFGDKPNLFKDLHPPFEREEDSLEAEIKELRRIVDQIKRDWHNEKMINRKKMQDVYARANEQVFNIANEACFNMSQNYIERLNERVTAKHRLYDAIALFVATVAIKMERIKYGH